MSPFRAQTTAKNFGRACLAGNNGVVWQELCQTLPRIVLSTLGAAQLATSPHVDGGTSMDRATIIEHYDRASAADDFETMRSFRHPEWQMTWPQSGETLISHENYVAMRTNRPEGAARELSRSATPARATFGGPRESSITATARAGSASGSMNSPATLSAGSASISASPSRPPPGALAGWRGATPPSYYGNRATHTRCGADERVRFLSSSGSGGPTRGK
jgi:hypothetical protein